jgi:hypothetical protein
MLGADPHILITRRLPMPPRTLEYKDTALHVLAPEALVAAVKRAATRDMSSVSEYTRRALLQRLREDGLEPRYGNENVAISDSF